MSTVITLAEAITGLVAEKRALGYKYQAEALVLGRFQAFSHGEFPGVDTVTRASPLCQGEVRQIRLLDY